MYVESVYLRIKFSRTGDSETKRQGEIRRMSDMFCYQCQQTAGNKGCVKVGVCGKQPDTARLQDELVIAPDPAGGGGAGKGVRTRETDRLLIDGLFTTLTNVNFDNQAIQG